MKVKLVLALVILAATSLTAQTFRGTILGTVTDPSGAVVPGAKVKVRNTQTGLERTTQTSANGSYSVAELPIGTYSVTISQSGFRGFVADNVAVTVATERRVDAQLQTGQVSEIVTVSGELLPQVETTTNEMGGTLTAPTVENLPVNGRDYTKLLYLNPGVSGSPDQITDSPGSFGIFSMNGARGRSNNFLLDGTDMNDGYRNDPAINEAGVFGTPATILPIDAVAEVRVISNFQPEYGRNAGAVVNIVTKSGTTGFHGTVANYFRNDALDARNFFNPPGQPKAAFHNNQYGASLGGPIVGRTFFFVDYEGQRESVGVVTLANVPRGTAPDGSLSPSQASNPVIAALLARHPWPAPNLGGNTASVISPSFNRLSSFIAKIDHNFNSNNIVTGRYFFGDSVQSFPLALTASGGQLPGFNTFTPTRVQLVSLSYVHIIGSNKVNELRYGWNRFAEGFFPEDQNFHPSSIGLCATGSPGGTGCSGAGASDSGLPIILVSGVSQLGSTSSLPRHRVDSNNQVIDNFSWKANKHDLKFGFDFHRTSIQQFFDKAFRGRLSFPDVASFLAGTPSSGFQYTGDTTRHTFENNYGLYVQDSFRATQNLTLNFGLRWDYFGVIGEKNNLLSNITSTAPSTGTGTFTLTQVGQPGLDKLYKPDYKNFGPRVSAAWDVTGKGQTVVRAGFGVFFDAFSQDMVLGHLPYPPFFDPGPAYNPVGSAPILSAGLNSALGAGGSLQPGVPIFGDETACNFECDVFAFDRNIRTPYMENYNINVQQQLGSKAVLQVGYVGSQGHRLWRFFDINQPDVNTINACDLGLLPAATGCTAGTIQDFGVAARPFGGNPYGAYYVMQQNSTGKSNYNSLQASLRLSSWHGLTSMTNFVWSKSLDNSSDGEDFEPNAAQPQNSNVPQAEYALSNFNVSKRFTWVLGYQLPQMGGSLTRLKNGWGVDSSLTLQSGQPFQFNINCQDDFSGGGDCYDRPDVVGPLVQNNRDPFHFFPLSSLAVPCLVTGANGAASDCIPGTRHYGNMRRNSLIGPDFRQWDLAIYKNTAITEHVKLQLRADFFNVLNRANFSSPFLPAFIADALFNGTQQVGNRQTGVGFSPLVATGDVGVGNPFLGGGGPRGIQLAAKITF